MWKSLQMDRKHNGQSSQVYLNFRKWGVVTVYQKIVVPYHDMD